MNRYRSSAKLMSAMCRARLTAAVNSRWCLMQLPEIRRGTIRPRSVRKFLSSPTSLKSIDPLSMQNLQGRLRWKNRPPPPPSRSPLCCSRSISCLPLCWQDAEKATLLTRPNPCAPRRAFPHASFSLRSKTQRTEAYASPLRSLRLSWKAFLSILPDVFPLCISSNHRNARMPQ